MTLTPQVLIDGLVFPESPRWHDGKLWFSDIHARQIMTVDQAGHAEVVVAVPGRPSGLGFLSDGTAMIVSVDDRRLLRFDSAGLRQVAGLDADWLPNDMVIDGQGRAYIGQLVFDGITAMGNIVLIAPDGRQRVAAEGHGFSNGMVITPDGGTLILADTAAATLYAFDIGEDGSLSARRDFARIPGTTPDGICLDAEGAVWLGSFFSDEFIRVKDGSEITHRIPVPGKRAVACMFGGDDGRTLFLCTADTTLQRLVSGDSTGWIETMRVDVPGSAGWP